MMPDRDRAAALPVGTYCSLAALRRALAITDSPPEADDRLLDRR